MTCDKEKDNLFRCFCLDYGLRDMNYILYFF